MVNSEGCHYSIYMCYSKLFPRICKRATPLHFFFFFHSPSAKMEKPASSIWKHFSTARFSYEGAVGWWEHDLQLCVRRNTDFLSEADWTMFHVAKVVSRKEFSPPLYPHFTFVKISAFWICLTVVRIQNPEIPGFFSYTNADAFWWLRFLLAAPLQPGSSRELRAFLKFSNSTCDHTTVVFFFFK